MNKAGIKRSSESIRLFLGYIGIICMVIGTILLVPLVMLIPFPEEIGQAGCFILPGVLSITAGYWMSGNIRGKKRDHVYRNQEGLIVTMAWILVIVLSSFPFMLTGKYNFTQAVFECTSGYSTTGLSVVNVTETPHIFLFFRSVMLFVGGIGLVLVVISVLSDRYGMKLYEAEGHSDKMFPNLIQSARVIVLIYSGYILAGMLLYMFFGMNWFDALNHAVGAVSTGGFSTRPESIGYYHSVGIEVVTVVLMLLGNMNFLVHLALLRGKWKKIYTDCECRLCLAVYPFAVTVLAVLFSGAFAMNAPESIRTAIFQAVSAMTTTGFQTVDSFQNFTHPMLFVLILLMVIGGGAGSTAGGMKQYRIYLVWKEVCWNLKKKLSSKKTVFSQKIVRCGEEIKVDADFYRENNNFLVLYLAFLLLGSFIFTCFGYAGEEALFEMASSLSTVGLSVGITGYDAHPVILWTSTMGMFMGRLEIYIVLLTVFKSVLGIRRQFTKQRNH